MAKKIVLILLAMTFLLTGCGKDDGGDGKITLTWSMWGLPIHLASFREAKAEYEKLNPNVKIKLINIPWLQYNNKLITMAAGKVAPDIFWIDRIWATELTAKNAMRDLAPLMNNDPNFSMDDFTAGINDYFVEGDGIYGLMSHYSVYVLLYNKDVFDDAGVSYPDDTWNWKTLEESALKISLDRNNDGVMERFGCVILPAELTTLSTFIWQNKGKIWDMSNDGPGIDSPQAKEAIAFLMNLIEIKAQPDPGQLLTSDVGELFRNSRLGFMMTWPSGVTEYTKNVKFNWGVSVMPKGKVRSMFGGGPAYAMSPDCKHPEQAWDFMKFLLSEKVQMNMAKAGLVMPSRKISKEKLMTVFPYADVIDAYNVSLPYGKTMPKLKDSNKIKTEMEGIYMQKILYKRDTIDNVCKEIAAFLKSKQLTPETTP